ncbi:expressed unknown protein [Ectocarpus siliculosus]|uniref:Uncharacterized protein n=1 Tax=Ectocarpus siliculosus TaxID=2880 RepID=D7FN14_ECTSI|nr:expressed unknown protein [Ectocarpus siliculosus]|eukprot:CBJ30078.1 expressed unknown protein [Ectocarpus siliculosus]
MLEMDIAQERLADSNAVVGVKATFRVQGQAVHQFDSSGKKDSTPAAAAAVGEEGPVEGTDKYDCRYTGRHDHGTLPALKTGGPHGELVKAIHDAKADSDAFLTELINKEASARDSKRTEADPGGAALDGKPGATAGEAMELEPCGAGRGAEASPQGVPLPPTPPEAQPAKRPRP